MSALRYTPFHPRTGPLVEGQAWRRWAGYLVASAYDLTHEREYAAIRSGAALIDISPLYKYLITGKDAANLVDRVIVRDARKCQIGQVLYTPWCDASGKVIDDGTVSRLDENLFRMTSAEPSLRWLSMNATGMDVQIEEVSEKLAALALQGPTARDILRAVCDGIDDLKFFRVFETKIRDVAVSISRTGYTGDLGYELWIPSDSATVVWDALTEAGRDYGLVPCGIWGLDIARIEAGLIMADVDYTSAHKAITPAQMSSPFELGLGWCVNKAKDFYVGKRALEKERTEGPAWNFRGLVIDWESLEKEYASVHLPPQLPTQAWRTSIPIYGDSRQVGYASSGCWSPLLKQYLALAHIEAPWSEIGSSLEFEITVQHRRRRALAKIEKTPFFDPERKRS